jgi:hypothetical protein
MGENAARAFLDRIERDRVEQPSSRPRQACLCTRPCDAAHVVAEDSVIELGSELGHPENVDVVSRRDAEELGARIEELGSCELSRSTLVAAAVVDPARLREANQAAVLPAPVEEVHEREGRAVDADGFRSVLGCAESVEQGLEIDAAAPEEPFAPFGAVRAHQHVHAMRKAGVRHQLRRRSEQEERDPLAVRKHVLLVSPKLCGARHRFC